MWDWFTPDGWPDSGGASMATEITYPKRLVQQIKSEEEMAHERLDTRVRNGSGDSSVSCVFVFTLKHLKSGSVCVWRPGTPRGPQPGFRNLLAK